MMSLTSVDHVLRKVQTLVNTTQLAAATQFLSLWWTQIDNHYGTISPSQPDQTGD